MLKKLIPLVLAAVPVLFSCSSSKKTLEAVQSEADALRTKNAQLEKNVSALKTETATLSDQNKSAATEFASYKAKCEETQKELQDVQALLKEQYDQLQQVKNKIDQALADFESKGVQVYYENGFVYVSLADELLFKSGSSRLEENGKRALSSLADVLNAYPNLKLIILGNTDSVQFKKGKDNWTLSTERANGVVRIFRDEYKIDPYRMTSAGKAKYFPVADNSTAEGRAKNRRIDIILNPDLKKLWDSVQK